MLKIRFASKNPHRTAWLEVSGPVSEFEAAQKSGVIAALLAIGWTLPPGRPMPDLNGEREISYSRNGTDLFNGWTPDEKKRFTADTRKVLKQHGYTGIVWHKKSLAEML